LSNGDTEPGGYTTKDLTLERGHVTENHAAVQSSKPADVVANAEHHHRELAATLERAAGYVVRARHSTHGPGGRGAHRKARQDLEAELGDKAAEWLAAGCQPNRVAEALADRFTGTNLGAVPWSAGDPPAAITPASPASVLEAEQLEPMTEAEWYQLPENVRAMMTDRCPNLTPVVAQ